MEVEMEKTISATEARIHFGELIQEAQKEPVTIERDGKPVVVVISKQEYDQLMLVQRPAGWRELLDHAHELIRNGPVKQPVPDPAEMLRTVREERDDHWDLLLSENNDER
jgi:prevent-host-death family protein